MASLRQNKLNSLLKRDLAVLFQSESKNLFGGAFISVTDVNVSRDMSLAKVYISIFTREDKEEVLQLVREKTAQIRGLLGNKIGKQVRVVPQLQFYIDNSLDYANEIDNLLKS